MLQIKQYLPNRKQGDYLIRLTLPYTISTLYIPVIPAQAGIYPLPPHGFPTKLGITANRTHTSHHCKKAVFG
jgi:hypothetical protein